MKQILLITDGCSNSGQCPIACAAQVYSEGVSVNVIGILDDGHLGERGAQEVADIAAAGGGMSRIVFAKHLAQTMQMMTRQTVTQTIQRVVNEQLRDVFGKPELSELAPAQKAKVVEVMDQLQETMDIRIAVLIDSSLSMKNKLSAVEEAIADLLVNIQSRRGKTELCLFHFPASADGMGASLMLDWTSDLASLPKLFRNIEQRGVTPTGPALITVLNHLTGSSAATKPESQQIRTSNQRGLWSEYVV